MDSPLSRLIRVSEEFSELSFESMNDKKEKKELADGSRLGNEDLYNEIMERKTMKHLLC